MIKNFLQNMNHKSLRHHRIYANHVAKLTDRRKKIHFNFEMVFYCYAKYQ